MAHSISPDITVAVMSYNNADYIGQTIESVLGQEGVSLELIVFDDCSTDHSVEVLDRYRQDPRFRYEVNPRNLGMMGNYNRCLDSGSGRYVVVLGSDDLLYPNHLASQFAALELHPQAPLVYTQCNWINERGELVRYDQHKGHLHHSYFGHRNEVSELLTYDNYITPSAVMLRRSIYAQIRLDDGHIHRSDLIAGDWELWTRIARSFPDFIFLHQATVGYRVHGGQISQSFYESEKPLFEHAEILQQNLQDAGALPHLQAAAAAIWALYLARLQQYPAAVQEQVRERSENIHRALFPAPAVRRGEEAPLFSVIITTFNRPDLLRDALLSVENQLFSDFELILVNDAGEPVEQLLAEFAVPITYIRQGRNQGLSAARNAGLRQARGRYVCFLDDDDLFAPEHLQILADAVASQPADAVLYTDAWYVGERIESGKRVELSREIPYAHSAHMRERLWVANYIPVNSWCVPRELFAQVGDFDVNLPALEDWEMLLRFSAGGSLIHLPEATVEVRVRESAHDRMSQHQRKNFPALFRDIYSRYPTEDAEVAQLRQQLLASLDAEMAAAEPGTSPTGHDLEIWLASRTASTVQNRLIDHHLHEHGGGPTIFILILDHDGDRTKLTRTIESLREVVVRCGSLQAAVITTCEPMLDEPANMQWFNPSGAEPVALLNRLVQQAECDWFMLVEAGEEFTPSGMLMVAVELAATKESALWAIYGDELQRQANGVLGAVLRPSFNLDLWLSFPLSMTRHWLFRRESFLELGGFDPLCAGAIEFDLQTRLIESGGMARVGHIHEPLLISDAPVLADNATEIDIIQRHLGRRGYDGTVLPGLPGRYRIAYKHPQQPLVSIIIPSKDQLPMLQRCVESLLEKTRYQQYEVLIVDNNSEVAETLEWLAGVEALADERVRVLRYPHPFNFSAINNMAAQEARGEYLVLLNNDTAIVREDWLDELLNHAQRPEVGIVGAKLLYPDGRIQHAGVVLGLRGPADHPFIGEPMDAPGYMQRLQVDQNYSAVTAACLMIRKSIYEDVGGMDEQAFRVSYNDVDLCLKVGAAGYLNVWTPHAVLLHEGSVSQKKVDPASAEAKRKRFVAEQDALYTKWLAVLAQDPAYNRNLSLSGKGFELESDSGLTWRPLSWRPLPVVLAHPADPWGCGNYRVIKPFEALRDAAVVDGMLSDGLLQVVDLERYDPDVIVLQRQIGDERLEAMRRIKQFSRAFKVYELDDYLPNLPIKSVHREQMPKDILKSLRRGLSYVDRFVVSTAPLAEALSGFHPDIRVIENRLPADWWTGLSSNRQRGHKPRVGWAGGVGHTGDLELISDVVRELAGEVEWVFFGMCPAKIRPYVHEIHAGVDIERYPAALASLDLDLALAPVEQNLFNECKSNLRLLEYGACGFPVVCSDVLCYRGDLPVTRVKNRFKDWVDAIRAHTHDLHATARMGDELRGVVLSRWMLDGHNANAWRTAWLPD